MSTKEIAKPKRREMLSREVMNELLIYDHTTHRGHCLNSVAAVVWRACDGDTTVPEMVRIVRAHVDAAIDEPVVELALSKLAKAGLLLGETVPLEIKTISRREVVRRVGTIAVIGLPVVTSMLMPTPARAASCFPALHACGNNAQCCSGHCGVNLLCL
jgi:hypothetical protein